MPPVLVIRMVPFPRHSSAMRASSQLHMVTYESFAGKTNGISAKPSLMRFTGGDHRSCRYNDR